jgi:hypothetical protein
MPNSPVGLPDEIPLWIKAIAAITRLGSRAWHGSEVSPFVHRSPHLLEPKDDLAFNELIFSRLWGRGLHTGKSNSNLHFPVP